MSNNVSFTLRYAARTDVGLRRQRNEDSVYAGPRLLAVADGMGGHSHGEVASATVIAALSSLDGEPPGADPLGTLEVAITEAGHRLKDMAGSDPKLTGMGTTLTAMLWDGMRFALAHIGDSRAYMLRDGSLYQITRDHTLVQSLVDDGQMTAEQAAAHPRRSLLMRALGGSGSVEPDLSMREARAGDRYLVCSDGLSGVVGPQALHETLTGFDDLGAAADRLIQLARDGGGPDNITCVVAEVPAST
ncbi:PP2C family serine/threonine-protein phosphatase [Sphaerisporangium sp. TRM90804]|uniref:PP2C family protein-serine/threonine phosphatase n=1 Tax=Sphaerisporangium sp. TRM90804 TaxID=3031113 RepID=UPI0024495281|nr:PP2C family serine/threonine-protein phosphatase [Sphaerisporangium sp. TRM90804]MDH2428048.1 protein phosphatase 2C domain-containing protein [Sphaerisporangium sp. TRM90804]